MIPPVSGDVAQVANLPSAVAQAFGINTDTASNTVNRNDAMSIPAVRRGRTVIAGTLGTAPLVTMITRSGQVTREARPLLDVLDPNATPSHTLTWTVDDLLFYPWAWWRVTGRDATGYPATIERIAPTRIAIDTSRGVVRIDGTEQDPRDLIRFDGPDEGLLNYGGRSLRTALLLEAAVRRYATMDVPLGTLAEQDVNAPQLEDEEIQKLLDDWETARATRTTAYTGRLRYESAQFNAEQLQLSGARDHQAAEIARLLNLPPRYINAPVASSLTYNTTESDRRELVDLTFAPYRAAIEQRLSMPDVTPRGTRVLFDLAGFVRGDTQTVVQTGAQAVTAGLMTVDEVRTAWLQLPPMPAGDGEPPASED